MWRSTYEILKNSISNYDEGDVINYKEQMRVCSHRYKQSRRKWQGGEHKLFPASPRDDKQHSTDSEDNGGNLTYSRREQVLHLQKVIHELRASARQKDRTVAKQKVQIDALKQQQREQEQRTSKIEQLELKVLSLERQCEEYKEAVAQHQRDKKEMLKAMKDYKFLHLEQKNAVNMYMEQIVEQQKIIDKLSYEQELQLIKSKDDGEKITIANLQQENSNLKKDLNTTRDEVQRLQSLLSNLSKLKYNVDNNSKQRM